MVSNNKNNKLCLAIPYLGCLASYLHVLPQSIYNLSTIYMEYLPWNMPSNFNQKICIKCRNHKTSLYWECEGHASLVPMQPTNKHSRISYIHKVNNSMTQLLSMSHTFKLYQMHCSISNNNTHCKMTYGCLNMFLSHDRVTPSRILLLVISSSFPHSSHVSTIPVSMH